MSGNSLFISQISSLRFMGIKKDIKDSNKLRKIGYITLKKYAYPFLHKNKYTNLSFKKLLLIIREDHKLRSKVLNALKVIELDIDHSISTLMLKHYGKYGYLYMDNWADMSLFKNEKKSGQTQEYINNKIYNECKNEHEHFRNEFNEGGYPSIELAAYKFKFGDANYFIHYLSKENKKELADYYNCSYHNLISWLECLRYIRNICSHKGVLIDVNIKNVKFNSKIMNYFPNPPKFFKPLIYIHNIYSIASVVFIIKYLMLTAKSNYDFGPIKSVLTKLIDAKTLNELGDKNNIYHSLGFKDETSLNGLIINRIQFLKSFKSHLDYTKNNPYIHDRHLLDKGDLLEYLKYDANIHNLNLSFISSHYLGNHYTNHERSYIHATIRDDTLRSIKRLLRHLSDILATPIDYFNSILYNGNYNKVKHIKKLYINQKLATNDFTSEYHHNYIWAICTKRNISPKLLAKILNNLTKDTSDKFFKGKHFSVEDVRMCIESSKKPNVETVYRIAKALKIKPYYLAKHLGYRRNTFYKALNRPQYHISLYINKLMKEHGITQKYLSHKLKVSQAHISSWLRSEELFSLNNLIDLSNIFNVPLLTLLNIHPKYSNIQYGSPSFKVIELCKKYHIKVNENEFIKLFGKYCGSKCNQIITKLRNKKDFVDTTVANKIIKRLDLSSNYFGETHNRQFSNAFNSYREKYRNEHMNDKDIGFRIERLRILNHLTLNDIAKHLGKTRERVRQLTHIKGLKLSKRTLKNLLFIAKSKKQRKYLLSGTSQQLSLKL